LYIVNDALDDESDADSSGDDPEDGGTGDGQTDPDLQEVQQRVRTVATDLVGSPLDGVVGVRSEDGVWYAVVEVVERRAVPDTQDILGRYEIQLDGDGSVQGYRRVRRFRRSETDEEF
jgi:hypothetical protein